MVNHTMIVKAGGDPTSGWSFVQNANSPINMSMDRVSTVIRAKGQVKRYAKIPLTFWLDSGPMQWPDALTALSDQVREIAASDL